MNILSSLMIVCLLYYVCLEVSAYFQIHFTVSDFDKELRNEIYSYAFETSVIGLRFETCAPSRNVPEVTSFWNLLTTQWLGHNQVCWQIRAEYLTSHCATTRYGIQTHDLDRLIKLFVLKYFENKVKTANYMTILQDRSR
jgi:hypothetical protein